MRTIAWAGRRLAVSGIAPAGWGFVDFTQGG
jgi:hypothetical protein